MHPERSWFDGIPFIGQAKALIYFYQNKIDECISALSSVSRNTTVIGLGLLGGELAGFAGSVAGSIIGGLIGDAIISNITFKSYGYCRYLQRLLKQEMRASDWFDLLHLAVKDTFIGLLTCYALNELETAKQSLNSIQIQNEIDFNSFMEEKGIGLWSRLDFNTITVILELSVRREIQIPGMKYTFGPEEGDLASSERVTHILGVMIFGFLGGTLTASSEAIGTGVTGSIIGGFIGGVFIDVAISTCTSTRFGYLNSKNVFDIIHLGSNDVMTGYLTFECSDTIMVAKKYFSKENKFDIYRVGLEKETGRDMYGSIYILKIQRDMSGIIYALKIQKEISKCNLKSCEKVDIIEGGTFSEFRNFLQSLIWNNSPKPKLLLLDDISQLEPGDHLVYTGKVYDHHAIVGTVFPEEGKYTVYEQSPSSNTIESMSLGKATIKENVKSFDAKALYKIDHGETGISKDNVWKHAHFICHHTNQSYVKSNPYNVNSNNCEHFANLCDIGQRVSFQVQEYWITIIIIQLYILAFMRFFKCKASEMIRAFYLYQHVLL